jgi:3-keto-5-aminohexanoate cleavage enzyme
VHARNPDGSNTMDPAIYGELHDRPVRGDRRRDPADHGGSPRLPVEERLNTVYLSPEMCSLNMGC